MTMRLLANENVPRVVVGQLRDMGHDVAWVTEVAPGLPDSGVLRLGREESRVLLTFDRDFGELAFRACLPATSGVILLRVSSENPAS